MLYELWMRKRIFAQFWAAPAEALESAGREATEGMIFIETDLRKPAFSAKLQSRFGDDRASAVTYSCYAALAAVIQAASRLDAPAAQSCMQRSSRPKNFH